MTIAKGLKYFLSIVKYFLPQKYFFHLSRIFKILLLNLLSDVAASPSPAWRRRVTPTPPSTSCRWCRGRAAGRCSTLGWTSWTRPCRAATSPATTPPSRSRTAARWAPWCPASPAPPSAALCHADRRAGRINIFFKT